MMLVMDFDTGRCGRFISQAGLNEYTRWLAIAVTGCLHDFIGHDSFSPHDESGYLAVSAAHIIHMLRDTFDDLQLGYYNIPRQVFEAHHIRPQDVQDEVYRAWVRSRVQMAREHFKSGNEYFTRVQSWCGRMVGTAYIARFEWLLDTIVREGYLLRPQYNERKSLGTGLRMSWLALSAMIS
jgi:phytoene/squalene synthetase